MTSPPSGNVLDIAAMLVKLEPLHKDEYFTAFGLDGRFFFGTPNGYAAAKLPKEIVKRLASGLVKKVKFVSFGSHTDAWFICYEKFNGKISYETGKAIPGSLLRFLQIAYPAKSENPPLFLRVQFGINGSYIAWTNTLWTCHNIPGTLEKFLRDISFQTHHQPTRGVLRGAYPTTVTWHQDGSCIVIGHEDGVKGSGISRDYHVWNFAADAINNGWKDLWQVQGDGQPYHCELSELMHVAINPFTSDCNHYIFIKTQKEGAEPDFTLRFGPEESVSRLSPPGDELQSNLRGPRPFRRARSRHKGRPTRNDTWELLLNVGEEIKVLEDKGQGWFLAENMRGELGFVLGKWLDFKFHTQLNPSEAYGQFQDEVEKMLKSRDITTFPKLSDFADSCRKHECEPMKEDSDGLAICVHDLEGLLRGSGCYSRAFLKEERNKWHPDKFARFCHPDHRDELKNKAERMFVLMGILMDLLEENGNG